MSRRDQLTELDQKIATTFHSAAEELRQEIVERLQETRDRLHRLVQAAARQAPDAPESRPATGDLTDLRGAISALVAASTQDEILDCLLSGATRFCERAAIFLVDDAAARVWAGRGFPADFGDLAAPTDDNEAWRRLIRDQGAMRLSCEDCRQVLGGRVDAPTDGGVLIPMALADRLAGALYADALGNAGELPLEPLQLLVQSASHCLESLSLRPRRLPVSLRIAVETSDPGARLELWSAASRGNGNEEE